MLFSEVNPFVRFARYLYCNKNLEYGEVVGLDARLFYTVNGYGKIKVNDTEYEMTAHSLLLINSGIRYHIQAPENSVEYVIINFDYTRRAAHISVPVKPETRKDFCRELLLDACDFEDEERLSGVLYVREIEGIQKKLIRIVSEYMQRLLYHEEKSGHLLAECIADALRASQIGCSSNESENADRIISYIQKHYTEDISNLTVGKEFGYHPNYVSYLVKHMTRMPLHSYVIHLRLMNAARLLETTEISVSEVAIASGFCDTAYFSGYFKKYFGVAPTKYRKGYQVQYLTKKEDSH